MFKKIAIFVIIVCSMYSRVDAIDLWPFGDTFPLIYSGKYDQKKIEKRAREQIEKNKKKQEEKERKKALKERAKEQKKEREQIEKEIKSYKDRQNVDLYVGEGRAVSEKDSDNAEAEAKNRAIDDLSSSIRIKVQTTVKDELKYASSRGAEEKFERITKSYTREILKKVISKPYKDYPEKNMVTMICYVSKSDYERDVQEEIKKNIVQITKYAIEGLKAQKEKLYLTALENFLTGKENLKKCFYELPAQEDIDNDGKPDDLYAFFDTNIIKMFRNIKLEPVDEKVVYGTDGKLRKYPVVKVIYEEQNEKVPIANIKVNASFIEGKGNSEIANRTLLTNRLGEVQIPIERIDSSYKETSVQVELDPEALKVDEKQIQNPFCVITISRKKTFLCAVNFFNTQKRNKSEMIENSLKAILRSLEYDVIDYNMKTDKVKDEDIRNMGEKNADYLIAVIIKADGGKVGDYEMFYSYITSKAEIYSLPEGDVVASIDDGPSAKGFGTSASNAGWDALGKIKSSLISKIKKEIKGLK
ncbi:MAG: hypothetical protein KJ967_00780 [Elusimicrobia bacterium]|nr:hypothetical protein [Elusimicrobiota bacterium]